MSAIGGHLRSQHIYNYTYLDDWFLKNADQMTLEHQLKKTLLLLIVFGLVLSIQINPTTNSRDNLSWSYLSLLQGIVDPSVDRFHSLCEVISTMGTDFLISAHTFFRFIGLKAVCIDLVPFAKLQMFPIKSVSCPNGVHM